MKHQPRKPNEIDQVMSDALRVADEQRDAASIGVLIVMVGQDLLRTEAKLRDTAAGVRPDTAARLQVAKNSKMKRLTATIASLREEFSEGLKTYISTAASPPHEDNGDE